MLHVTKAGHGKICKHYVVNANLIKARVVSSVLSMLAKHEKTDSELQHFGHTLEGSTQRYWGVLVSGMQLLGRQMLLRIRVYS